MSDGPELSREQLQSNWQAWVNANLGTDPDRGGKAASAAVDAMLQGKTLAVASAAATNAWTQAGGRPPTWRLTVWGLLIQDRGFLTVAVPLIIPQLLWFSGAPGILTLLFDVLFLPPVVVRIVQVSRLARNGIVAPGTLVKTAQAYVGRRNGGFVSTYEFVHDGPQFASRLASDTPQDVLVLFDPSNPNHSMVIPTQLSVS